MSVTLYTESDTGGVMADLEKDNLEEDDNNEDEKLKYYNYDDNEMYTMYLKSSSEASIKIDKVADYYELFVRMLKTENKKLHTNEHLWILGIDKDGYSVCVYIVTLGYPNFFSVDPASLFKIALQQNSVKIIICQSKPDAKILDVTPTDLDLTNLIYHKAEILGLELVDHIIISNSSINKKKPFYCSHLENGAMCFVQTDMTYKSYKDIEPEIEKARNEYGADQKAEGELIGYEKGEEDGKKEGLVEGEKKKAIDMAKKMLSDNEDISKIIKYTELTAEDIVKIKKDMNK